MYKNNILWLVVLRRFNEHRHLSINDFLDKQLILRPLSGALIVQLDNALEFLRRNFYIEIEADVTPTRWTITPIGRLRLNEIDASKV